MGVMIIILVFLAGLMLGAGFLVGRLLPEVFAVAAGLAIAVLVCYPAYGLFAAWGYADTGSTENTWGTWMGAALAGLLGISHFVGAVFGSSARQEAQQSDKWGPPPLKNDEGI